VNSETSRATMGDLVVVTGVSGYIGAQVCAEFLDHGYRVRGTVRNSKKVHAHLVRLKAKHGDNLEIVDADITNAEPWEGICQGTKCVAHTASPFALGVKGSEAEEKMYKPARDGTLNVLEGAHKAGVPHVVLTSSMAAIMCGRPRPQMIEKPEELWTDMETEKDPYNLSKTMAEKAAWDYYKDNDHPFTLSTINPGLVVGETLSSASGESHTTIARFLSGKLPLVPNACIVGVSVKDVAAAHRLAFERHEQADGKRFAMVAWSMNLIEIARILNEEFESYGYKISTRKAPKFLLRIAKLFDSGVRAIFPDVDDGPRDADCSQAKEVLGIEFQPMKEALIEHAHSALRLGVPGFKQTKKYKEYLSQNS